METLLRTVRKGEPVMRFDELVNATAQSETITDLLGELEDWRRHAYSRQTILYAIRHHASAPTLSLAEDGLEAELIGTIIAYYQRKLRFSIEELRGLGVVIDGEILERLQAAGVVPVTEKAKPQHAADETVTPIEYEKEEPPTDRREIAGLDV